MSSRQPSGWYLRRLALAVAVAAASGAAGCGHFHRGGSSEPALLFFTNESLDQADVFAVAPGVEARRIGTVMAGRTDTLRVPIDLTERGGSITIVARLLAKNIAPNSGPVSVYSGEAYQVRLPPDEKLLSFLPAS